MNCIYECTYFRSIYLYMCVYACVWHDSCVRWNVHQHCIFDSESVWHIHIHVYTRAYEYECVYAYICVCIYVYMCVYTRAWHDSCVWWNVHLHCFFDWGRLWQVCLCVYKNICVYLCVGLYMCVHICMHVCVYMCVTWLMRMVKCSSTLRSWVRIYVTYIFMCIQEYVCIGVCICHTHEWVTSHIRMSHVTHMNESRHTYMNENSCAYKSICV